MAYKVPLNIIKASKALCVSIIKSSGGPSAIANSLEYNRQYVFKWVKLGYVPLVQAYDVSQLLKVSQWVISYHKLLEVFGENAPSFSETVKDSPLLPAEKKRILDISKNGK